MGLPFVKPSKPPIGVDFSAASLKAIQLHPGADSVSGACAINTPHELAHDDEARLRWQFEQLPRLFKHGKFHGKRAVCSINASMTLVESLAVAKAQGVATTDLINEKLRSATGLEPNTLVIRHEEIGEVARNGARTTETLCFAIPRAIVKEHMRAIKRAGLDTVGAHCQHAALSRAMQTGLDPEENTASLILDLDTCGARAVVVSGGKYIASRTIEAALDTAAQPQELGATGTGGAPVTMPAAASAMTSPALETVAEELGQCLRYCTAVRPDAPVKQAVFVGALATNDALCTELARRLRLPASVVDPLANYAWCKKPGLDAPSSDDPKPAWAVALGLCLSPTDL